MINVCAHGNPLNPKVWSGTPSNICNELKKKNLLGKTINFTLNPIVRKPLYLLSKLYYNQKPELNRGRFLKGARSIFVSLNFPFKSKSYILHMSNMALPLSTQFKNQKHFLYLDSTWNIWSSYSHFKEEYSSKFLKEVEELECKMYRQLTHIFTISQYVKQNLIEHYKVPENKITVVGTGRGKLQPYFGEKDYCNKEILFTAKNRFIDKGGPLLIEAFNEASKLLPDLKLHIVGMDKIDVEFANSNIIVHGFLPFDELQALFNRCSLFAMPAMNEPWGLVYLEALACKMPIVGLNMNAFPELSNYGQYGYMLKNNDYKELSNIIVQAFTNPQELEQKGKDGQEWCLKNFTWEKTTELIVNKINE